MSLDAQEKFNYDYTVRLISQGSEYELRKTATDNPNGCYLVISVNSKNDGVLPIAPVSIMTENIDSNFNVNEYGYAKLFLTEGIFVAQSFYIGFEDVVTDSIFCKNNSTIFLDFHLGKDNKKDIVHILSKKSLSDEQINQIIDDISFDKKNELIEKGECTLLWEL